MNPLETLIVAARTGDLDAYGRIVRRFQDMAYGYTQKDIADFLELPLTTVQKRLHDSRSQLKERMITMAEQTLKNNAPDEQFSQKVIAERLGRPKLLEIDDHPVRQVWERIKAALPDYEVISGNEIEDKSTFAHAEDHAWDLAYHLSEGKALRYQMTTVTMTAIRGTIGVRASLFIKQFPFDRFESCRE